MYIYDTYNSFLYGFNIITGSIFLFQLYSKAYMSYVFISVSERFSIINQPSVRYIYIQYRIFENGKNHRLTPYGYLMHLVRYIVPKRSI